MKKNTYEKGHLPNMACEFTPELKQRLEKFEKERQELHIPALPNVFVSAKTEEVEPIAQGCELSSDYSKNSHLKTKSLISEKHYKANSFTRHFEASLIQHICGGSNKWRVAESGYNLGRFSRFIASSYSYGLANGPSSLVAPSFSFNSWLSTSTPDSETSPGTGIVVGYLEGVQEYYQEHSFHGLIAHSVNSAANKLFYFNPSASDFVLSPSDNTWTIKVERKIMNNSGSTIYVNHIGVFAGSNVLMEHTVLPETVAIEPNVVLTVTYELKYAETISEEATGQESMLDAAGIYFDFDTLHAERVGISKNWLPGEDFDQLSIYGNRRKCMMALSGEIIRYENEEGYDEVGIGPSAVTSEELIGKQGTTFPAGSIFNIMIEQPKFYYRIIPTRTTSRENGDYHSIDAGYFYISDEQKAGFRIHPAFLVDGIEKSKIYFGAYIGRFIDGKLRFIQNLTRDTTTSLNNYETEVSANNSNGSTIWRPMNYEYFMAEKLLSAIEYCSFSISGLYNKSEMLGSLSNITGRATPPTLNIDPYLAGKTFFKNTGTDTNGFDYTVFKYRHSFLLSAACFIANFKTDSQGLMFSSEYPYAEFYDIGIKPAASLLRTTKFVISNPTGDCDDAWFLCGLAINTRRVGNGEAPPYADNYYINIMGYMLSGGLASQNTSAILYSPRASSLSEGFIRTTKTTNHYSSKICLCIP